MLLLLLLSAFAAEAQHLLVLKMERDYYSKDAIKNEVKDTIGNPCALVKVRLAHYAVRFYGDVVKWEYRGDGEHWVYVPAGAKRLEVVCQAATPLTYEYKARIDGGGTYILTLGIGRENQQEYQMTPSPKAFAYLSEEDVFRYYAVEYSVSQRGWGNSFGGGRRWGWHCNMMVRYTPEKIDLYLPDIAYYSDGDIMYDFSSHQSKTYYSFSVTLGAMYHLLQSVRLVSGLGYTYRTHEYLPGGVTLELGMLWNVTERLLVTATYENIGLGIYNVSSLRLGLGFTLK